MRRDERYYRSVAATVLQRYAEVESGMVGQEFDPRLLDYRIDVERILVFMSMATLLVLTAIYCEGVPRDQACAMAGVETNRPDEIVRGYEAEAGRRFEKAGLSNMEAYLS